MIEIIIIYFLLKEVHKLAIQKGQNPLRWKIRAFMAWLLGEIIGVMICLTFFPDQLLILMFLGLSFAYLSFLLLKKQWESLPDVEPHEEDQL